MIGEDACSRRRPAAVMSEHHQYAALPYRWDAKGRLRVLLITSRGTGRWVLPKGWAKADESGPQAALREALEEAGVVGRLAPEGALGSYGYERLLKRGRTVARRVTVYGLHVDRAEPQFPEQGQRVLRWFAPERAAGLVQETELSELCRRFSPPDPNLAVPSGGVR